MRIKRFYMLKKPAPSANEAFYIFLQTLFMIFVSLNHKMSEASSIFPAWKNVIIAFALKLL